MIGLFELVDIQDELTQILGLPVDLVPKAGLKPRVRDAVLASEDVPDPAQVVFTVEIEDEVA